MNTEIESNKIRIPQAIDANMGVGIKNSEKVTKMTPPKAKMIGIESKIQNFKSQNINRLDIKTPIKLSQKCYFCDYVSARLRNMPSHIALHFRGNRKKEIIQKNLGRTKRHTQRYRGSTYN